MKLISINVSLPKDIEWKGKTVSTGIFKAPLPQEQSVWVGTTNLEGDGQADLTVHGGRDKAVYAYSTSAFAWWTQALGRPILPGEFGENLTITAMDEAKIYLGDVFKLGEVELEVVQPRFPCFKLAIKFGDPAIIKTFMQSNRPGIYFRVLQQGKIRFGQTLTRKLEHPEKVSVVDVFQLPGSKAIPRHLLERMLRIEDLTEELREKATRLLGKR